MKKKSFGIIGNPITHSLSPVLHNYWFKKYNIEANYSLLNVTEENLKNVINKIRDKELKVWCVLNLNHIKTILISTKMT